MKLSVVMPVYNERDTLPEIVEKVRAAPMEKEIIIVDDGSTDGSREFLRALDLPDVKVIHHERNQGKGMAIRTGLEAVMGDVVIIQDADLEYDPSDYEKVVGPILRGEGDVVYGNRWHGGTGISYRRYLWGGRLLSALVGLLYGVRIHDEPTCYKAIRTSVLKSLDLECRGFEFCAEVTAKLCRLRYTIHEVDIRYHPRSFESGKKIRWYHGAHAVWTLIKWRMLPVKGRGKA
ncbi:MAG: glycosyltransferase family 2 protein [Planctomycetes bacterium]|nr:glycosyltransferase family 2 protein [Planctomycetota bacterium]